MKMNDFVVKTSLEDVAHSSGYARVQSGSNFGATSSKTFTDRMALDRRNAKIRAYRESRIAQMRASNFRDVSKSAQSSLDKIRANRLAQDTELSGQNNQVGIKSSQNLDKRSLKHDFSGIKQSGLAGCYTKVNSPSPQTSSAQIRPDFYR